MYSLALQKLTNDFIVCHIHPNNVIDPVVRHGITLPTVLEITLINKYCLPRADYPVVKKLPHPLDVPNSSHQPSIVLSQHWFKGSC